MSQPQERLSAPKDWSNQSEPLRTVADALERLRYGVIQLTVHDGKLMQVDITERRRFG